MALATRKRFLIRRFVSREEISMFQPPNLTSNALDPAIRECRESFLRAVEKYMPAVLRDLKVIFEKRLTGPDLDRALNSWADHHHLYPWILEIARRTMDYWTRQPGMSRTRWKLPQVQTAAVWDETPFLFRHRGFHLHIDGDLRSYAATVRREFESALASYAGRNADRKG